MITDHCVLAENAHNYVMRLFETFAFESKNYAAEYKYNNKNTHAKVN